MSSYKMISVVGTSTESNEQAVRNAIADAARTMRNLAWFEVREMRGRVGADGGVEEWQVKVEVGFRLDRDD